MSDAIRQKLPGLALAIEGNKKALAIAREIEAILAVDEASAEAAHTREGHADCGGSCWATSGWASCYDYGEAAGHAASRAEGLAKELEALRAELAETKAYCGALAKHNIRLEGVGSVIGGLILEEKARAATARVVELEKQLAAKRPDIAQDHAERVAWGETLKAANARADAAEAELARLRALPDGLREELESKLIGVVLADVALWGDSAEGLDGPGMERLSEVLVNAIHAALAAPLPSAQQVRFCSVVMQEDGWPTTVCNRPLPCKDHPAPQATPAQPAGHNPEGVEARVLAAARRVIEFYASAGYRDGSLAQDWLDAHPAEGPSAPAARHEGEK